MTRFVLVSTLLVAACGSSPSKDEAITPAALVAGQASIPYPPELFKQHIEGEVLLLLFVDSSGTAIRDSSQIVKSSGHPEFDAAALKAAPTLRFTPAVKAGVHVAAPIQVPIHFSVPDSISHPTGVGG